MTTTNRREITALRVLQWASLTALALAILLGVLQMPGTQPIASLLVAIAIGSYVTYAVIDIRRRRHQRQVTDRDHAPQSGS
jgi:NADH:ubiquinone oxidoreductase subunit 2 (subunit N)